MTPNGEGLLGRGNQGLLDDLMRIQKTQTCGHVEEKNNIFGIMTVQWGCLMFGWDDQWIKHYNVYSDVHFIF